MMPVIGFLGSASAGPFQRALAAFRDGLKEAGYIEGRNVLIEYRWAEDRYDRLLALAAELVHHQVAVIIASGGPASALAAKVATTTIPIVFTAVSDPVASGLVASLNRPGGNVTGMSALTIELDAKRLELLRELAPAGGVIAALINPGRPDVQIANQKRAGGSAHTRTAACPSQSWPRKRDQFDLRHSRATENRRASGRCRSVLCQPAWANHCTGCPAHDADNLRAARICGRRRPDQLWDETCRWISPSRHLRRSHSQRRKTGRSAGGPTNQVQLVLNLKTAKALGLTVPPSLLVAADEVMSDLLLNSL